MSVTTPCPEVLATAADMVPTLRERRARTDELRRLPDETVKELRAGGMLGIATPAALGGSDLGPDIIVETAMELGRGCGSTAWCAGNWAVHNLLMAMFPAQAQQEVFAGPELPIISTGFSPLRARTRAVPGGAVVSGQWDFSSGIDHAEWVIVVGVGETGPLAHVVPRADVQVVDTWRTSGLRGTGSHDVAADELFVPEHRVMHMGAVTEGRSVGREMYDSPFLRLPLGSYFGCGVIGAVLGMARGALDVFVERTVNKVGGLSGVKVSARADVHLRIGEAAAELDAAVALIRSTYADMRARAVGDAPITLLDRIRWRRNTGWCGRTASRLVTSLYDAGGAHVLFDDDQLQQFHRDINAGSHHYSLAADVLYVGYGRTVLGEDPQVALL